jgi:hypothetical protein
MGKVICDFIVYVDDAAQQIGYLRVDATAAPVIVLRHWDVGVPEKLAQPIWCEERDRLRAGLSNEGGNGARL